MTTRQTLTAQARFEQIIRHSRFVAIASAVDSIEAALAFVAQSADDGAGHHGWAYRVGAEHRCSDDGEPAGSAGRPILAAIDGQQMDGVVVVVARWFGGIKLGVGGLVRAYGGSAAECLRAAPKRPCVHRQRVRVICSHSAAATLRRRLDEFSAMLFCEHAGSSSVDLQIDVADDRIDAFAKFVADLTRGTARIEHID